MHAGMNASACFFAGQQRSQGQASRKRLCHCYQIRLYSVMLISKPFSSAPEPALDLVGDQQRVVFARQIRSFLREFLADRPDAAFTLHEFKTNSAYGGVKLLLQVGDIVELHKIDT